MPFPWTLQRYILKEMGTTFLLAAAALTGVLGLGGGVFQMIKLGEVTPGQLLRLLALVLPVAAALTLPIAVLFSAAATFGRLSADNEFVACRASGINLHVLFLPTVVLGLGSACITFVLINFLIPGMVRNLNLFLVPDAGTLVRQRLDRPRGITLGGRFRIRADPDNVEVISEKRVTLHRITYAELEGEEWGRFGTAREARIHFDAEAKRISARLIGLSFFDRGLDRYASVGEQTLEADQPTDVVPMKLRFLNFGELLHFRRHPDQWRVVRKHIERLRADVGRWAAYRALWEDWLDDHALSLVGEGARYTVRADSGAPPHKGGIELSGVTVEMRRGDRQDLIRGERAVIEVVPAATLGDAHIRIDLYDVTASDGEAEVEQPRKTLSPIAIDPRILAEAEAIPATDLLMPAAVSAAPDPLSQRRAETREEWNETVRRIVATLNERVAFSVSVVVLVILGAALGIIFRGSHVLTAFGISFVPLLVVIVAIVTGKQMAHNASTYGLGLGVLWSGIAMVAALDCWTLARVLRR